MDNEGRQSDPGSAGLWEKVVQKRLGDLESLSAREVDVWPARFDRTHSTREIRESYGRLEADARTGQTAAVAGRVRLIRDFGRLAFITLSDQTGDLQLFLSMDELAAESAVLLTLPSVDTQARR